MEDVVKNATTELISGRKIELVMNLKGLLHSCNVYNIGIVLISYHEPDYTMEQIDIEIHSRDDFDNFIATYGNSVVDEWTMESADGIPYMIFDLKKLVKE